VGILQAAILALSALILAPGYWFGFDVTPKTVVLLTGVAAALVFEFAVPGQERGRLRAFGILLGLTSLSLAISTALSARPLLSFLGSNWRQFGAVAQIAVMLFAWLVARRIAGRPERALPLLRGVSATAILAAAYGIGQYFGVDPVLDRARYHIGEGMWTIVRPPGSFGYVSYYATWLTIAAFCALLHMELERSNAWRWMARIAAVLAASGSILSGTRAAIVGLVAGGCVLALVRGWRPGRRQLVGAALLGGAFVAFYFSPAGWNLRSRTRWFIEDPWGGARPRLWQDSVRMAVYKAFAGYGPEVFLGAFPRYESYELASAYPDFAHESPHNILLDSLVAQGVPGLLLALGWCWLGVTAVRRYAVVDKRGAAAIGAALAAGFVCQQFTVFTVPTALLLFGVLGIAAGMSCQRVAPPRRWMAIPALAAACLMVLTAGRIGAADRRLALAEVAIEGKRLAEASAELGRYRSLGTDSGELWYSRALLTAANAQANPVEQLRWFQAGREAAERATLTAEDPFNAWYSAAMFAAAANDPAAVEQRLRMAIAARPNWFKPHWTLAQLLALRARQDQAIAEAELAVRLDRGKHPEVGRTLTELQGRQAFVTQK
jgi:hypothetical protein